jgi:hypothetical protein
MRQALRSNQARGALAAGYTIPAPVGGWDTVSPLAAMPENSAVTLDNWFPQPGFVEVRRGHVSHATGMGSGVVETLMTYAGTTSSTSKLFACANGKIYNATAAGAATEVVGSMSNNRWQWTNLSTSAGKYLWCCNGANQPRHYNGTTWAVPSLTITTYADTDIINVCSHKRRLWFTFKNSMVMGYLPVDSIAGTVTNFDLGPIFTRGGYIMAAATWTIDGGDGSDDKLVIISSEGQVAVYIGTDPASSTTWGLEGVYTLGSPIGRRCFTRVGGDVALVNIDGVLPLSKALGTDRGAAPNIAITARINQAMNDAARLYRTNFGWELTPFQKGVMAILNVPIREGIEQHQYVMNTLTGAWCRFIGQNANTWAVFENNLYFGGNAGVAYKADTGPSDAGTAIDAIGQCAYSYLGVRGRMKQFGLVQPLVTTDSDSTPSIGLSTDFKDDAVLGTPTPSTIPVARYDTAVYDTDIYPTERRSVTSWTGLSGYGQAGSLHFRAKTSGSGTTDVVVRLNGFNMTYTLGGFL